VHPLMHRKLYRKHPGIWDPERQPNGASRDAPYGGGFAPWQALRTVTNSILPSIASPKIPP